MQRLREVPFFDVIPIYLGEHKPFFDGRHGGFHGTGGCQILASVAGASSIWLGTADGRLLHIGLNRKSAATQNPLVLETADNGSTITASDKINNGGVATELGALHVDWVEEHSLFKSRLTHLAYASAFHHFSPPSLPVETGISNSASESEDREILVAVGREGPNEWRCKIYAVGFRQDTGRAAPRAQLYGRTSNDKGVTQKKPQQRVYPLWGSTVPASPSSNGKQETPAVQRSGSKTEATETPPPLHEIVLADSLATGSGSEIEVVAVAVNPRGTKLVVAFSNGSVVYYRGDFRLSRSAIRGRRLHYRPNDIMSGKTGSRSGKQSAPDNKLKIQETGVLLNATPATTGFNTRIELGHGVQDSSPPKTTFSDVWSSKSQPESSTPQYPNPVTHLAFGYSSAHASDVLFVTTRHTITSVLTPDGSRTDTTILFYDSTGGCPPRCAALLHSTPGVDSPPDCLAVLRQGNPGGLFVFNAEQGNLSALPCINGVRCTGLRCYTAVLHEPPQRDESERPCKAASPWGNDGSEHWPSISFLSEHLEGALQSHAHKTHLSVVLNLPALRFTAYSARVGNTVDVFSWDGTSMVLLTMPDPQTLRLSELREQPMLIRIDLLVRKRLFDWAVELAQAEQASEEVIQELYSLQANWLFEKQHYTEAAMAYVRTIGSVEPSYVITRFLGKRQLEGLIVYLKALFSQGKASKSHIFLLLKAFCLLGNEDAFLNFLQSACRETTPCDVTSSISSQKNPDTCSHKEIWQTAIQECRLSGHSHLAARIARMMQLDQVLLDILLQDLEDHQGALELLQTPALPMNYVCHLFLNCANANALIEKLPGESVALIKKIAEGTTTDTAAFIPIFLNISTVNEMKRGRNLQQSFDQENPSSVVTDQATVERFSDTKSTASLAPQLTANEESQTLLLEFLMGILVRTLKDSETVPPASLGVYSTVLELLLRRQTAGNSIPLPTGPHCREISVEGLIQHHAKSDDTLLASFCLSHLYHHTKGLLLVCERAAALFGSSSVTLSKEMPFWVPGALYAPFLCAQTLSFNSDALIHYSLRCGLKDRSFWYISLPVFASIPSYSAALPQLLHLDADDSGPLSALRPLTLLRVLGQQSTLPRLTIENAASVGSPETAKSSTIGDIKEYLFETLSRIRAETQRHREKADADLVDLLTERKRLYKIHHSPHFFRIHDTCCSRCDGLLDFPMICFFCGHAFHRLCLTSSLELKEKLSCPICSEEYSKKQRFLRDKLSLLAGFQGDDDILSSAFGGDRHGGPWVPHFVARFFSRGGSTLLYKLFSDSATIIPPR